MRAEEDRSPLALDELDHRYQEVAAGDGVQAERGVIEDEQLRIRCDGQRERDVARWPCESRRIFDRRGTSKWSRIWSSIGWFHRPGWNERLKRTASATVIQPYSGCPSARYAIRPRTSPGSAATS